MRDTRIASVAVIEITAAGIASADDVHAVVLQTDGSLSVISTPERPDSRHPLALPRGRSVTDGASELMRYVERMT